MLLSNVARHRHHAAVRHRDWLSPMLRQSRSTYLTAQTVLHAESLLHFNLGIAHYPVSVLVCAGLFYIVRSIYYPASRRDILVVFAATVDSLNFDDYSAAGLVWQTPQVARNLFHCDYHVTLSLVTSFRSPLTVFRRYVPLRRLDRKSAGFMVNIL